MDDLLAQLKNEFEPRANSQPQQSPPTSVKPNSATAKPSIEEMLEALSHELEFGTRPNRASDSQPDPISPQQQVKNSAKNRDRLNALIDQDYQRQADIREAKLAELQRQEAARIAEQQRRQQELIEAQKQAALREQRRKAALKERAQQWLKDLNPRSEEGKWFEEFSYSYEDKLQAAIDYLEAMGETGL